MKPIVKKRESLITRQAFPFEVVHAGEPANSMPLFHWHDFLELSYVEKGSGTYEVEDKRFDVGPGDIVIINDIERHRVTFDERRPLFETVFHFTPSFIRADAADPSDRRYLSLFSYDGCSFVNKPLLPRAMRPEIRRLVRGIVAEYRGRGRQYELVVRARLLTLVALLLRVVEPLRRTPRELTEKKANIRRLEAITGYLRANFGSGLSLPATAARFKLNATYFSEYFKANIGIGFHDYLTRLRVQKAAKKLDEEGLSVTRIAYEAGFTNTASFYTAFKKVMGETPRQYRQIRKT